MTNILTQPVKLGNFNVPLGLIILVGAGGLALLSLNQKKGGGGSGESAGNTFLGLYDAALNDVNVPSPSVSAPPSYGINPQPIAQVASPISNPVKTESTTQPVVNQLSPSLIDSRTAALKYSEAKGLVNQFANAFYGGNAEGVYQSYAWYDVNKKTLVDNETRNRFYA